MNIDTWNFWIGFLVTCGFAIGFIIGAVKWYHTAVANLITKRLKEGERRAQIDALNVRFTDLEKTLNAVRKDITPNGKNTQRLGDIAARSEEKIDNLMAFMERYAVKVDGLEREIAAHLGYHDGAEL
jgi:outer membrane murein-binding lipoprotein Lpp